MYSGFGLFAFSSPRGVGVLRYGVIVVGMGGVVWGCVLICYFLVSCSCGR